MRSAYFAHIGVGLTLVQFFASLLCQLAIAFADSLQVFLLELFQIEQGEVRAVDAADQFIQLDLDGLRIAVLRVLDHEHHQKGNDGGAGVDDQLPGIAEAEEGPLTAQITMMASAARRRPDARRLAPSLWRNG